MIRSLLHTVLVAIATVAVCIGGVLTASTLMARTPAATFAPPSVEMLAPDPDRPPTRPVTHDRTVVDDLPPEMRIGVPAGIPRPLKTSAWWSSGILEPWPAPIYALPMKGIFTQDGLTLLVPRRRMLDRTVLSGDGDALRISAGAPASRTIPIAAGDWDVTFRALEGERPQFDATFVQGSPYVFVRSNRESLTASFPPGSVTAKQECKALCGSALLIRAPRTLYLLASPVTDAFDVTDATVNIRIDDGSRFVTIAAIAPGSDVSAYLAAAMRPFARTEARFSVSPSQVRTTFSFPTPTIMGLLPHHAVSLTTPLGKPIGAFETIRGPIRLYAGKAFTTALRRPSIIPSLPPLPSLRFDMNLRSLLQEEIRKDERPDENIYFAAKDMYRAATLAETADLLGEPRLRDRAVIQARNHLIGLCSQAPDSPYRFGYDDGAGGIIATPPGFGSEHYNDHHFHYGYLLHAAAIVGRYDADFLHQFGDCFRLLARDMASPDRSDPSFPYLRHFDPYGGHSWAGGLTLFGDGNNQESASEAAHAWYALALFGRTVGEKQWENLGTWMFAQEAQAERVYWLDVDPGADTIPQGFGPPMISILWGGKTDYATFFDASDAAIRGIQFFPVTPALFPIVDKAAVTRIIAPARAAADRTIWKSGLAMAGMLFNRAVRVAPDDPIDPVYSRSGVEYWQRAFVELGEPLAPISPCAGYVFKKNNAVTAAIYRFPGDPDRCTFSTSGKTRTLGELGLGWNVRVL